jgi:hypothetical protein
VKPDQIKNGTFSDSETDSKDRYLMMISKNKRLRRAEMSIQSGNYLMRFSCGGVEVLRDGLVLYFNKRPMYAFIKTALSITEFYDAPYQEVVQDQNQVTASGLLKSPTGAELYFKDVYEPNGAGFKITRTVTVCKNIDDYGFASKIAFVMAASDDVRDYDYFAPANWYRQNESRVRCSRRATSLLGKISVSLGAKTRSSAAGVSFALSRAS